MMKVLGPLRQGARTVNLNRRNHTWWPTTSTITEFIPEKKVAFRVNANGTIWSYEFRARTRRRHEPVVGPDQGGRRKLVGRLPEIQDAVIVRIEHR